MLGNVEELGMEKEKEKEREEEKRGGVLVVGVVLVCYVVGHWTAFRSEFFAHFVLLR